MSLMVAHLAQKTDTRPLDILPVLKAERPLPPLRRHQLRYITTVNAILTTAATHSPYQEVMALLFFANLLVINAQGDSKFLLVKSSPTKSLVKISKPPV